MTDLSVDYVGLTRGLSMPAGAADLGAALFDAVAERYRQRCPDCSLVVFDQSGAEYLYDLARAAGGEREERTVAAWTVTPAEVTRRDVLYQRNFPMAPDPDGGAVDRGHLIPHLSGGAFGPNIFRQQRALNRGWSQEGRRFRALEREAAARPGAFYFGHLLYADESAYPMEIETGVLRGDVLHVERFRNRVVSD